MITATESSSGHSGSREFNQVGLKNGGIAHDPIALFVGLGNCQMSVAELKQAGNGDHRKK